MPFGRKSETVEIVIRARDAASRGLKNLDKGLEGARRRAGDLSKAVFSLQGALVGLGAGLIAKKFLDTADSFERLRTQLVTVTGSSKGAEEALAWVTDFTAKTPFQLDQVAASFTRLSAYGLDATKRLGVLGDTASAMGKSLDQSVEMFADAITGEFERLKEFGIRASQQGDKVTFRWMQNGRQMVKEAEKTQEGISTALTDILAGRFEGAMARYSKTWAGMMSNLKDRFTLFKLEVMESGVFDFLKEGLSILLEKIKELKKEGDLAKWAKETGEKVLAAFKGIAYGAAAVGDIFRGWREIFLVIKIAFNALVLAQVSGLKKIRQACQATLELLGFDDLAKRYGKAVHEMGLQQEVLVEGISDARVELIKLGTEDSYWSKVGKFFDQVAAKTKELKEETKETTDHVKNLANTLASKGARDISIITRLKASTQTALAVLTKTYKDGEIALREYFARRRALLERQFQAEMAQLGKLAEAEKDPTKKLAIEDKMFARQEAHKRVLIQLAGEQEAAEKRLFEQKVRADELLRDMRLRATSTSGAGNLQAQFQEEQAEMDQRQQEEIQRLEDLNAAKTQIDEAYRLQKLEKDRLLVDQERRLQEYRLTLAENIAGGMAGIFTNLYELTGRKQKEFFYLAKAAALAQAIINMALAVSKALAQGGIMGIGMAAVIGAQGAIQVAKISAQQMAAGGRIRGSSPTDTADNVPIWATANEWVMPVWSGRYYGEKIMEGIRSMRIPRELFSGLSLPSFRPPAMPARAFAAGGPVSNTPAGAGEKAEEGISIVNVIDPNLMDQYMATTQGERRVLNILSNNSFMVKQLVTG